MRHVKDGGGEGEPLVRVRTSTDVRIIVAYAIMGAIVFGLVAYWYNTHNYAFLAALFIVIPLHIIGNQSEGSPPPPPPRTSSKKKNK